MLLEATYREREEEVQPEYHVMVSVVTHVGESLDLTLLIFSASFFPFK